MKQDPRIEKALKQIDLAITLHAKTFDALQAAKAILASEPTEKDVVKRLFDCWHELWKRRYREGYVFAGAKDGANFKRLLKTMQGEEIARRMKAYLDNADPFLTEKRHPLPMFLSTINRYGQHEPAELELSPAPTGCTHTPPCLNDVEHTRKMMAELRSR